MSMNTNPTLYALLVVAVMAVVTLAIRFLPFLLFDRGGELPKWIRYLGMALPPAVMSVLLVYCVRNVDVSAGGHGIPEALGIACAVLLHLWKRNTLLSIGASTVLYMVLVQTVFG